MYKYAFMLSAGLLTGLCGCSGFPAHTTTQVPVDDRSTVYSPDQAQISQSQITETLEKDEAAVPPQAGLPDGRSSPAGSEVVLALLQDAEVKAGSGKSEHAAAAIERALSIEPKNALLWSRLAAVRLQQQDWQQAYILANKSNSLARGNPDLQIENWRIIEKARYEQGDQKGARQAEKEIEKLTRMQKS